MKEEKENKIILEIAREARLNYKLSIIEEGESFLQNRIYAEKIDGKFLLKDNSLGSAVFGVADSPAEADKRLYDSMRKYAGKVYRNFKSHHDAQLKDSTPQASQLELKFN
jgi:hypothetical protein